MPTAALPRNMLPINWKAALTRWFTMVLMRLTKRDEKDLKPQKRISALQKTVFSVLSNSEPSSC